MPARRPCWRSPCRSPSRRTPSPRVPRGGPVAAAAAPGEAPKARARAPKRWLWTTPRLLSLPTRRLQAAPFSLLVEVVRTFALERPRWREAKSILYGGPSSRIFLTPRNLATKAARSLTPNGLAVGFQSGLLCGPRRRVPPLPLRPKAAARQTAAGATAAGRPRASRRSSGRRSLGRFLGRCSLLGPTAAKKAQATWQAKARARGPKSRSRSRCFSRASAKAAPSWETEGQAGPASGPLSSTRASVKTRIFSRTRI
mmetsp:Transcript_45231/g.102140  ORF Transcript_45231/g.102140 Transcript_45231/m.102140 type:complete len:256 (-) Transcript_45231:312-1079(-)